MEYRRKIRNQVRNLELGRDRPRALTKPELNLIAGQLVAKVQEKITDLKPKHYRSLQALGAEWYRQIYHTRYQISKADYLKHLYETAVGDTREKETNKTHVSPYIKALSILKDIVAEPTTAGLPDPNSVTSVAGQGQKRTADTASSQPQAKAKRGTSVPGTYATAVTGKADGQTHLSGAKTGKSTPAKVPAKYASGAIGAPVPKSSEGPY